MTYTTTNELRNTLTLSLGILGLEESLITQLLSDDFINGAFELTQNIPENDEFMNFVRNFSEEQSLKSLINAQNEITEEFCTEGHFTSICQYVIDAWRNINFSVNVQPMSSNNENEQEENNSPKPIAILNTILDIAGFVPSLKPIVEETRIYEKIAIAVHNQDKKIYDIAEQFDQELWAIATGARKSFTTAENQASPLVIDLDGDGVETTDTQNGIYFDHDDNGFAENSSWVGKDDGLLVRDLNNNGQIDNGTELFGNNSVLSSGEKAANGFEALADLDSNNDGIFNSSDTAWNEVKVWKDVNSNGEVDEGELLTLEQANIVGINLDYQNSGTVDENGNPHKQTGTFTKTDGSTGSVHDVWFDADYANTIDTTEVEISETIAALPNIQGFGNMHDLHTAMALDTSGELKTLIEQYIAETDPVARRGMIDNIIFHWAGVEDIDPLSRKPSYFYDNPIGDARYLEVLERFLGQKYSNRWWFGQEEQNPHEQASQHLLQGYDILATYVSNELEAQTHCKTLLENIKLTWNSTTQVWDVDVSGAVNILNSLASENISATVQVIYNLEDIIKQQNIMSDEIIAVFQTSTSTVEALQMYLTNFGKLENRITAGDDIINGSENDDNINALSGNDKIYGESGNDILAGGAGDDYLVGGSGSDTYFFEGSWGHDSIDNSNTDEKGTNPDKILFGEGINPSDVTIQRRGNDLILSLHNGADTITVYSYFLEAGTTTNTIDTIEFANGTVWDYDDVRGAWNSAPVSIGGFATISGTNDNDTINGTSGTDFLSGEKGNDVINANAGNDVIYGGAGNDTLRGAGGNDVYIWNWGDGLDTIYDTGNDDTISFGIGITPEMLKFSCVNEYDLKIIVNGNESQGSIINDFFSTNLNYKIEKIQFYAGQSMLLSEVGLKLEQSDEAEIINGTPHNDTVFANGGHDTVNAGTGDDTVYGGRGDDVLNGNTGNDTLSGDAGFDSLYGESGDDVLSGGSGNDYLVGGAGDDTYLYHIGDGLETIYDYVNSTTDSKNDKIKFGEGITPNDITFTKKGEDLAIVLFDDITQGIVIQDFFYNSYYQIEKLEFADGTIMDLTADLIFEYSDGNDIVSGTANNDIIYGQGGDDELTGNNGNDTLIGGEGDDTLYGGNGDDTYIWNLGDGLDYISDYYNNNTIKFGEGITLENLTFERGNLNNSSDDDNLYIFVNGNRNQGIKINSFFFNASNFTLQFADGTTFVPKDNGFNYTLPENQTELQGSAYADTLTGNNYDNELTGNGGDDILAGGKGNDGLNGGNGDDTYVWNLGDGLDSIYDYYNNNTIKFGEGITLEDLTFERGNLNNSSDEDNLYIFVNGDRSQGIKINSFFFNGPNFTLKFTDGTTFVPKDNGFNYTLPENQTELQGSGYADTLSGNDYDNELDGNGGDDILAGGKGNDGLNGGNGDDIYVWNLGDGLDSIYDYYNNNTIKFGEGITLEDLTFERGNLNNSGDNNNLYIFVNGDRSQGIKINSFFFNAPNFTLKFADGTTFVPKDNGFNYTLPENQTELQGSAYADTLTGNNYDNELNGDYGDDTLIGGKGDDTLYGGNGNDTYVWNLGDGLDYIYDRYGDNIIEFGEGIVPENLTFERGDLNSSSDEDNLYIFVNGDKNQGVRLEDFFYNASNYTLKFANGATQQLSTDLPLSQLPEINQTLTGTIDDDILTGGNGYDIINAGDGYNDITGGQGNDTITGGYDRDTYYYNLGDGFDTITDPNGKDQIIFGEGISKDDIKLRKNGNDLWLIVNNDLTQGMKLVNFFTSNDSKIETLKFSDDSSINLATAGLTLDQWNTDDNITGTSYNDIIYGNNGQDTLSGGNGKDILIGGRHNDILKGGADNDIYVWNLGDGFDTIEDNSGLNSVEFGENIDFSDLIFSQIGNNLYIEVNNNPSEGICLSEFFYNDGYKNFTLKFKDGSQRVLNENDLILTQKNASETITGTNLNDIIYANDGNDTINTLSGHDTIYGGNGNDTINGGNGDDILIGGRDNDSLTGGTGNDTYVYNLNDGADIISDSDGVDKISFGSGITANMLSYSREGNDLRISLNNDKSQSLLIKNHFANGTAQIEGIELADGNVLSLINKGFTFQQSDIDDTINGTIYDDVISTLAGNDTVNAGDGDDIVVGGAGCDNLNGGSGDDTYIYNIGDGFDMITETSGTDKIIFETGISLENLRLIKENNNLRILINNETDQGVLLVNQFSGTACVEQIQFADGSTLDLLNDSLVFEQYDGSEIISGTDNDDTIYGQGGDDTINAGDGDDTIIGGSGKDILSGSYGRDTYIYNLGDGSDTIEETRGNDTIKFGMGISANDIKFRQNGSDLVIIVQNDENQKMTIKNFYNGVNYQIEKLEFADGSSFNLSTQGLTLQQFNADDTVNGTSYNDVIYGNGGHDTINAGGGNDTIIGGIGNDMLNGGAGDDIYKYNLGDGFDTISETGGMDKIVFGNGISREDLSFEQTGNSLRISFEDNENKGLEINDHFRYNTSKVETIEFADGTTLDLTNADQLIQAVNSFGADTSSTMDALSNPTENVSDMYNLAAGSDLIKQAI